MKLIPLIMLMLIPVTRAETLNWKERSFKIDVPVGWKSVNDLFGIPVTLMGPFNKKISARPLIQVIPTNQTPMSLSEKDVKSFNENYIRGRKSWLAKNNGTLQSLFPAKVSSLKNGMTFLTAGVNYSFSGKGYVVRTYYVNCPKHLYNLKIFLHSGLENILPVAEEAVRSFQCGE